MLLAISFTTFTHAQKTELEELNARVVMLYQQGQYSEASKVAKEALKIAEETLGPENPQLAVFLNNLAILYHTQGKYSEAISLYKKILLIDEKTHRLDHSRMETVLKHIAECNKELGKNSDKKKLEKQAKGTQVINNEFLQHQKPFHRIFTVQVGAFRNGLNAITLEKRLNEKGYNAYIYILESKNEKKLYKVRAGAFSERKKAETLSEIIKKNEGIQTFVTFK